MYLSFKNMGERMNKMIKSIIKYTLVFVLTAALAVGAASSAYVITRRIMESNEHSGVLNPASKAEPAKVRATETSETSASNAPDYYMVRLEGESVGVYAAFDDREDFLYSAEVFRTNLSEEDTRLLLSGVKLKTHDDLASFIEDYTS